MMMFVEIIVLVIVLYMVFLMLSFGWEFSESMLSSYECGFNSVMGSRVSFSYRFFLISILFLVFDVEITLMILLPYMNMGLKQVVGVVWFVSVLLIGLLYEYYNGVLSWMEVENV